MLILFDEMRVNENIFFLTSKKQIGLKSIFCT